MLIRHGQITDRRSDLMAGAVGVLLALVVGLAGVWITQQIQRQQAGLLEYRTEVLGASVARSVAQSVERALNYGIPFKDLYGVTAYLDELLLANEEVAGVQIHDREGQLVFSALRPERRSSTEPLLLRAPILSEGVREGEVLLEAAGSIISEVREHQFILILAAALAAGAAGAALTRIYVMEAWDLPRRRLMAGLAAMARGVFASPGRVRRGSAIARIAALGGEAREPLRTSAREVSLLEEELRSIDIDGSQSGRIDAAVGRSLDGIIFDRQARAHSDRWWSGWWNLLLLVAGTMTLPLVGGFAADRVGFTDFASASAAAVLALEAVGGLLGLLVARALPFQRFRILLVFLAGILAGIATMAVAEQRDLVPFLAIRLGTSFCIWFAITSVILTPGYRQRAPGYCALLLMLGLVLGPILGALLADGLGRRMAFICAGVALLFASLVLILRQPDLRLGRRHRTGSWRQAVGLCAAMAACSGLIAFDLAAILERHDYAALAAATGLLGAGLGLGLLVRQPAVAPLAWVAALAAVWLPLDPDWLAIGLASLIGLALGAQISRGWRPGEPTGLAAALAGLGLGPALAVGAIYASLPEPVWLSGLFLLALALLVWPRRKRQPLRARHAA
ncbi:MAG: hypothetical protein AAFY02_13025 [Pseudomonadota bacterium]